jgi:exonuclease III
MFSGHNSLTIFHQNIRGLQSRTNELISSLHPEQPHVLCLTEHHLSYDNLHCTYIQHYNSGAAYCRNNFKLGGSCIFVHEFLEVNLSAFCKEKDLEACAVKISFSRGNICVLSIYRAPSGNFVYFLKGLETILKSLYSPKLEFIICGDININYLVDSNNRKQLDALLSSFNLFSIVDFPTRIQITSSSAIENIFIDRYRHGNYTKYSY